MNADVPLWQLLCYGAFCVGGGIFAGWIIWKAPGRRRRCGAAVFGPGVHLQPEYHCGRKFGHPGHHRENRRARRWREWRERW